MKLLNISIEQLVNRAPITQDDLAQINLCRRQANKLGFGYQLSFVKLFNRFPVQLPFEVVNDILEYVSVQLRIPSKFIQSYTQRRETLAEHQERIRKYLNLARFSEKTILLVNEFLFLEALST